MAWGRGSLVLLGVGKDARVGLPFRQPQPPLCSLAHKGQRPQPPPQPPCKDGGGFDWSTDRGSHS